MIVVDAKVIAYRFIEGEKTVLACRVQEKDGVWAVPSLWRLEFLNVLATTVRAGLMDTTEACTVWRNAARALGGCEQPVDYEEALSCAVDSRISAYDAEYATLARTLDTVCVTEDARLVKALPDTVVRMKEYLSR